MIAELCDVYKSYGEPGTAGYHSVLDGISLKVAEKETLAITGPSGSGKSTLLNLLGTLDRPDSGSIRLNGAPVDDITGDRLAEVRNRYIGFVFQRHHLLPQLTLLENVLLPVIPLRDPALKKAATDRAYRLLRRVGLETHKHRPPAALSVGECQRAAVVRALVNSPGLLLADEPTGSLDATNARELTGLLSELNTEEGLAIVLVTHSTEVAGFMHTLYRLSDGKLINVSQG